MATLIIAKMLHSLHELPVEFGRDVLLDDAEIFWQHGLKSFWESHIKTLRRRGLWSIYDRRRRFVFIESLTEYYPTEIIRSELIRLLRVDPQYMTSRPALQMVLSGIRSGQRLAWTENNHRYECALRLVRQERRPEHLRSMRHRLKVHLARDAAMAHNVAAVLRGSDIGILYVGQQHNVAAALRRLHTSIKIVELAAKKPLGTFLPLHRLH